MEKGLNCRSYNGFQSLEDCVSKQGIEDSKDIHSFSSIKIISNKKQIMQSRYRCSLKLYSIVLIVFEGSKKGSKEGI